MQIPGFAISFLVSRPIGDAPVEVVDVLSDSVAVLYCRDRDRFGFLREGDFLPVWSAGNTMKWRSVDEVKRYLSTTTASKI